MNASQPCQVHFQEIVRKQELHYQGRLIKPNGQVAAATPPYRTIADAWDAALALANTLKIKIVE
jgi:hypothetical protein